MYLKEMGTVPLLTREEEVEISKRIEKAQVQIERIILRFRYSSKEAISIAQYLINGKERFDKIISEKEVEDKAHFLKLLPKLISLLKEEDAYLESLLLALKQNNLSKEETAKLNDDLEKCRIRTQAYLRCFHCRHNVTEDFGEVVFKAYDSFLQLEQQINDLKVRAERNKFAAAKLDAAKRRLYKREVAAGRTLEEFKKTCVCCSVGWTRARKLKRNG